MFFLVNEFYKLQGEHVPMMFGPKISPEELKNDTTDSEWADEIKRRVYHMGAELNTITDKK
jgi:hypothetical protein